MTTNPTTPPPQTAPPAPANGKPQLSQQRQQELRNKYEPDRAPPSLRKFAQAKPPDNATPVRKFSRDW